MALDLDGTNDALTASSSVVNLDKGTFVIRVAPDWQINGSTTPRYFFDTDTARHAFYTVNTTAVDMQMYNDGRYTNFETGDISTGVFHLFAFVYNKTGNIQKLYIDGIEATGSGAAGTWGSNSLGTNLHIGQRISGTERMDGDVAEIAIYSDVLTDADILSMSKGFSPLLIRPDILTSYWKNVRDETTPYFGEYALTLVGSPTISVHPSVIYPSPVFSGFGAAAVAAGRIT